MPNSGSDWLCRSLAACSPGVRYFDKEFFNPITNGQYGDVLETAFGCEMVSCHRNIATSVERQREALEAAYAQTWCRESYDFDKEVFAAWKVSWLAEHFELGFLVRDAVGIFPPSRVRVWSWYDAVYNALGGTAGLPLHRRAVIACQAMRIEIEQSARALGRPVLDYQRLCTGDRATVEQDLRASGFLSGRLCVNEAVERILQTRRYENKGSA